IGEFIEESKLVFLDSSGIYHIINGHLGHWDESHLNWYSNYSYADYWRYGPAGRDFFALCDCCGNYVEAESLVFIRYLNVEICRDCRECLEVDSETEAEYV